jgi:hypothetical protein
MEVTTISNTPGAGQGITDAERERRKQIVKAYRKAEASSDPRSLRAARRRLAPVRDLLVELGIWKWDGKNTITRITPGNPKSSADIDRVIALYLAGELTTEKLNSIFCHDSSDDPNFKLGVAAQEGRLFTSESEH